MWIFPTGMGDEGGDELPLATKALALLLVVMGFAVWANWGEESRERRAEQDEIVDHWREAPYLTLPSQVLDTLDPLTRSRYVEAQRWMQAYRSDPASFPEVRNPELAAESLAKARWRAGPAMPVGMSSDSVVQRELLMVALSTTTVAERSEAQTQLDVQGEELGRLRNESSVPGQYGYVPARSGALQWLTYAFVPSGLISLLLSILFVLTAGSVLEREGGALLLWGLFVAGCATGAWAYGVVYADSPRPLVGAGAGVSALMAALLVLRFSGSIRFRWWLPFYLRSGNQEGTFFLPVWVTVLFYYAVDVVFALQAAAHEVSYWHVLGGLALGLGVGALWRVGGWRPTGSDASLEPVTGGGAVYARTMAARAEAYRTAATDKMGGEVSPPSQRVALESTLSQGDEVAILAAWEGLDRGEQTSLELFPAYHVRLARTLEADGQFEASLAQLQAGFRVDESGPQAPVALWEAGRLLIQRLGRSPEGSVLLRRLVQRFPEAPEALRGQAILEEMGEG